MSNHMGRVYLIGAGCGKADLITLRGLRLLQSCDVVVYDDLIDPELIHTLPDSVQRIYMGKRQGRHYASQDKISQTLIDLARSGKRVARLKGGDPFVFGRGGEEMLALRDAGIFCEEVPGITSAIAIPAGAGIPVTHRGLSQSLHIITAHTAHTPDGLPEHLEDLARLPGTLVFLMGLSQLEALSSRLIAAGKSPSTPSAVLSGGCAPHPAAVRAPLSEIAARTRQAGVLPPAVIVVGEVAGLNLTAPVSRPLEGLHVGLTGTRAIQDKLAPLLTDMGADVHQVMKSWLEPCSPHWNPETLCDGSAHWLVFTSANGAAEFFRRLREQKLDVRQLCRCKFAAIGPATSAALQQHGFYPDLCPETHTSEALAHALCGKILPGEDAILLRSKLGAEILPQILSDCGIPVTDIPLYTVHTAPVGDTFPHLDFLLFASANAVTEFFRYYPSIPDHTTPLCIGEVTAQQLGQHTSRPSLTAPTPSAQAMVDTLCQATD